MRLLITDHHLYLAQALLYLAEFVCRPKCPKLFLFVVPLVLSYRAIVISHKSWETDLILPMSPMVSLLYVRAKEESHREQGEGNSFEKLLKSIQTSYASFFLDDDQEIEPIQQHVNHTHLYIRTRAFPPYQSTFPCFPIENDWKEPETQHKATRKGLFYVKTYKTASTTVAGVAIRIAVKAAQRQNQQQQTNVSMCKARFEHWPAFRLRYRLRKRDESFLFAIVREPTRRAISMFFHFQVSRGMQQPLDETFQKFLTDIPGKDQWFPDYNPWGSASDHYLHFLSLDGYHVGSEGKNSTGRRIHTVNKILQDYDFIGITERLDESLVALQMILGLKTTDILYYSAKNKGSWDDKGVYIQPSFVSDGMEEFFASETWRELSKGDYLMYLAANASLDRTIESLGREEFEDKLAMLRYAKRLVATECTNILSLNSAAGAARQSDCLYYDAGCGNACFDKLESDLE